MASVKGSFSIFASALEVISAFRFALDARAFLDFTRIGLFLPLPILACSAGVVEKARIPRNGMAAGSRHCRHSDRLSMVVASGQAADAEMSKVVTL